MERNRVFDYLPFAAMIAINIGMFALPTYRIYLIFAGGSVFALQLIVEEVVFVRIAAVYKYLDCTVRVPIEMVNSEDNTLEVGAYIIGEPTSTLIEDTDDPYYGYYSSYFVSPYDITEFSDYIGPFKEFRVLHERPASERFKYTKGKAYFRGVEISHGNVSTQELWFRSIRLDRGNPVPVFTLRGGSRDFDNEPVHNPGLISDLETVIVKDQKGTYKSLTQLYPELVRTDIGRKLYPLINSTVSLARDYRVKIVDAEAHADQQIQLVERLEKNVQQKDAMIEGNNQSTIDLNIATSTQMNQIRRLQGPIIEIGRGERRWASFLKDLKPFIPLFIVVILLVWLSQGNLDKLMMYMEQGNNKLIWAGIAGVAAVISYLWWRRSR
jgi:hypothetical protein